MNFKRIGYYHVFPHDSAWFSSVKYNTHTYYLGSYLSEFQARQAILDFKKRTQIFELQKETHSGI